MLAGVVVMLAVPTAIETFIYTLIAGLAKLFLIWRWLMVSS